MTTTQIVHKSRLGFHACDRDTYLKLKFLNRNYWRSLPRYASWIRWSNKAPQNRFAIRSIRDAAGRQTGTEKLGPISEPSRMPIFTVNNPRYGIVKGEHRLNDLGIIENYKISRTPFNSIDEVKPLTLSLEEINRMYIELLDFLTDELNKLMTP